MQNLHHMKFRRKFSVHFFKNLTLGLCEMSFFKDFVNDTRGDPYPILSGAASERVADGHYAADGRVSRLLGDFFPYATYEMRIHALDGACGFEFRTPLGNVDILLRRDSDGLSLAFCGEKISLDRPFRAEMSLMVTARKHHFELWLRDGDAPIFITELTAPHLEGVHFERVFSRSYAAVVVDGRAELSRVCSYMDSGISQADIRPVKYENGDVMIENGKMYFTLTVRMHTEMYQAVFSWVPGTCEWSLCGAIFFDAGDGAWCSDVATSLKFNRMTGKWNLWVCSFSHGHILGCAEFDGDIRFGVNVVDIKLMPQALDGDDHRKFLGFQGDEDPDFIYDKEHDKWLFTVCRLRTCEDGKRRYAYHLFEGDSPFVCDRFLASAEGGEETGGSIVRVGEQLHFLCGNGFKLRANYRAYDLPDLSKFTELSFDYDDGGFRGWGTLVPIASGTRTRHFLLTFDRHNGSDYNWSYGNLYCFEAL